MHCDAELLAERNIFNFNQVKMHVFIPLLGEGIVLLGFRHPPHSVEHRHPVVFGALFREKYKFYNWDCFWIRTTNISMSLHCKCMQQVYVARKRREKHHIDEKTNKWVEGEMVVWCYDLLGNISNSSKEYYWLTVYWARRVLLLLLQALQLHSFNP